MSKSTTPTSANMVLRITLPGQVRVVNDHEVELTMPTLNEPILSNEAHRVFTDGLNEDEAEELTAKIERYATKQAVLAHIAVR